MNSKTIMILAISAAFVAGSITTGTIVIAQVDTIHACVDNKKGDVRIVESAADCDDKKETPIEWNSQGPAGTPGNDGQDGVDGSSCTISGTVVSCTDGTSADVQGPKGDREVPVSIKRVTLNDDDKGNAVGWNPPGSSHKIFDTDITEESNVLVTIYYILGGESFGGVVPSGNACTTVQLFHNSMLLAGCNSFIHEGAQLHYTVINSP